jgi:hypothetical protein
MDGTALLTVLQAARFAADHHARRKRWGVPTAPRIIHLVEVAEQVTAAAAGDARVVTDWVVAALLHEVLQDTEVTLAEVKERFGSGVAGVLEEIVGDKSLAADKRQRHQMQQAPNWTLGAQTVVLADLVADLRSELRQPPRDWDVEHALAHSAWASEVGSRMATPPAFLIAELQRLQRQLELFVRLARRHLDYDVRVLSVGYHQLGDLSVLREWWSQDGVEGDSAVLLGEQVGNLTNSELIKLLEDRLGLTIGAHTVAHVDEWVFVNWGMRRINSML